MVVYHVFLAMVMASWSPWMLTEHPAPNIRLQHDHPGVFGCTWVGVVRHSVGGNKALAVLPCFTQPKYRFKPRYVFEHGFNPNAV